MNNKILLVDDDEGILDAFKAMLESMDYDVVTSADGEVLLNLSNENLPRLIILDVLLSGQDGRVLCKRLKSDPITKNVPIIMVSAHPTAQYDMPACGADDFLKKPFEMGDMIQKVERFWTRQQHSLQ